MSKPSLAAVTLVLGGARSGKSAWAERQAGASGLSPIYLATAAAGDAEMAARIAHHQGRRGPGWTTVEEPLDLSRTLAEWARPDRVVLVDCLTLWLANLMDAGLDPETEGDRLAEALAGLAGPALLVSNEVGLGIVPDNALARAFRDAGGRLNQRVAAAAQHVVFLAAGLPLTLKEPGA